MNTPHLFICVEKPKTADERKDQDWSRWHALLEDSNKLLSKPFSPDEKPTENLWLLPVNENLLLASKILALCEKSGLSYKAFFLETSPQPCK